MQVHPPPAVVAVVGARPHPVVGRQKPDCSPRSRHPAPDPHAGKPAARRRGGLLALLPDRCFLPGLSSLPARAGPSTAAGGTPLLRPCNPTGFAGYARSPRVGDRRPPLPLTTPPASRRAKVPGPLRPAVPEPKRGGLLAPGEAPARREKPVLPFLDQVANSRRSGRGFWVITTERSRRLQLRIVELLIGEKFQEQRAALIDAARCVSRGSTDRDLALACRGALDALVPTRWA